jgi:TldD protein
MTTRRTFLHSAALAAVAGRVPSRLRRAHPTVPADAFGATASTGPDDPALRALALRAIDAARSAGARYADIRLTADRLQAVSASSIKETACVYAGVRALTTGGWGFAASSFCSGDALTRLGQEAVAQAKSTEWNQQGAIVLDEMPPTASGDWTMPVGRDPFAVSPEEMRDFVHEVEHAPERLALANVSVSCNFTVRRQEKLFAASTGAVQTQTCWSIGPSNLSVSWNKPNSYQQFQLSTPLVAIQTGGYDRVTAAWSDARAEDLAAEVRAKADLGVITMGRYTMVFDAATVAAIVRSTIGYATELDRVRGDEANSTGTSYLTTAALGTPVTSPLVSIRATRALPNGPSTVHWDDEGNIPETFDLITEGTLVDFATSRASATEIAAWSRSRGHAVRSHGCVAADSAAHMPLLRTPDLVVRPAAHDTSLAQLIANTKRGVAVFRGNCAMDPQQATGQIIGDFYEIRNGKLEQYLGTRATAPFRATEFWKNITVLGGTSSAELCGFSSDKGEPVQAATHGVVAVPMQVQNVALVSN